MLDADRSFNFTFKQQKQLHNIQILISVFCAVMSKCLVQLIGILLKC